MKMKKMPVILVLLVLSALVFGYDPTPYPVPTNGDPFIWDPNACPSPPMFALILYAGDTHNGTISVTEVTGDIVLLSDGPITINPNPVITKDPADPTGVALKYVFNWSWTPPITAVGVNYLNVRAVNSSGLEDNRTIVVYVTTKKPPVITGCN